MKKIIFISAIVLFFISTQNKLGLTFADTLSETIEEQLGNIDFTTLSDYFLSISNNQIDFYSIITFRK